MKKHSLVIAAICLLVLSSCEQQLENTAPLPIIPTITFTATSKPDLHTATVLAEATTTATTVPTLVYDWYPTITPNPNETPQPTITAPPSRFYSGDLPGGLWIEEYKMNRPGEKVETVPHPNRGGWYYWPNGGLIDGKLFQATERVISQQYTEIYATLDGKEIATIECGQASPIETVITAWVYENHWIVQSICHQEFDIFWDGISLNHSKGYQSSFAFQLLGKKPFYLFKRSNQVWLFYDEEEALLGYDKVKLQYCCDYNAPKHYENMIVFEAIRDYQFYHILIGIN